MPFSKDYPKNRSHDTVVDPVSLTEPEWADSCDINKMLHAAARGAQIRGGPEPVYGYDDTTQSGLDVRIAKQKLEEQLSESARNEIDEEHIKHIPKEIQEKFGFKAKKKAAKVSQKNDDQTTKKPETQQQSKETEAPQTEAPE